MKNTNPIEAPLVCVLMAAWNASAHLQEALNSVLQQDYPNLQLIVVDDGSQDETWAILQAAAQQDNRLKIYQNEQNLGFSRTRNRLLSLVPAVAAYVAVLDSDDVALPRRLTLQVQALQNHPEWGGVGSALQILNSKSDLIGKRDYPILPEALRQSALCFNPIAHSSLMIRADLARQNGGYDTTLGCCEDYEYILRLLEKAPLANLPTPLVGYRISAGQYTARRVKRMLWFTLRIQSQWLFRKECFSTKAFLLWLAKWPLFLLPARWILQLFRSKAIHSENTTK